MVTLADEASMLKGRKHREYDAPITAFPILPIFNLKRKFEIIFGNHFSLPR